jgi:hypothetical protein
MAGTEPRRPAANTRTIEDFCFPPGLNPFFSTKNFSKNRTASSIQMRRGHRSWCYPAQSNPLVRRASNTDATKKESKQNLIKSMIG